MTLYPGGHPTYSINVHHTNSAYITTKFQKAQKKSGVSLRVISPLNPASRVVIYFSQNNKNKSKLDL